MAEAPNLVALYALTFQVAEDLILKGRAGGSDLRNEFQDGIEAGSCKPGGGAE
jgi:hypothetical protein